MNYNIFQKCYEYPKLEHLLKLSKMIYNKQNKSGISFKFSSNIKIYLLNASDGIWPRLKNS